MRVKLLLLDLSDQLNFLLEVYLQLIIHGTLAISLCLESPESLDCITSDLISFFNCPLNINILISCLGDIKLHARIDFVLLIV